MWRCTFVREGDVRTKIRAASILAQRGNSVGVAKTHRVAAPRQSHAYIGGRKATGAHYVVRSCTFCILVPPCGDLLPSNSLHPKLKICT